MKKIIAVFALLSISSTTFAIGVSELEKQNIYEASNYGLCQELKLRAPKGDEALVQVNCQVIIKSFELKMEKRALLKRIGLIDSELKKIEASDVEL